MKIGCKELHQVEVAEVDGEKVTIKAIDDKIVQTEALDLEVGLLELYELIQGDTSLGDAGFMGLEISDVIVEVTDGEELDAKVKVEVIIVNCDECQANKVCDLQMEKVVPRQDDLHKNKAGKVKVAVVGGNVVEVPLKTPSTCS